MSRNAGDTESTIALNRSNLATAEGWMCVSDAWMQAKSAAGAGDRPKEISPAATGCQNLPDDERNPSGTATNTMPVPAPGSETTPAHQHLAFRFRCDPRRPNRRPWPARGSVVQTRAPGRRRRNDHACRSPMPASFRSRRLLSPEEPDQLRQRIIELVDHPLLEGDDRVVGDRDVFRADLRAALGDVAVPDRLAVLQVLEPVLGVERVHLERRRIDEVAWTAELRVFVVVPEHMTDVLAQEALDALPEFLHAIDVLLLHPPRAVRRIGFPRRELPDLLLDLEVPRHVGHEVANVRECAHRLHCDRLVGRQLIHPGHAHQARLTVDLGRAGATLPRLAVPAHGEVTGTLRLDLVHGVEDHHAFGDVSLVIGELPFAAGTPPDLEGRVRHSGSPI